MKTASFTLQIEDGNGSQSVQLLQPVSRLGSADYCEIHVQSSSPHAATIMVQQDHVIVINRMQSAMRCGKQMIAPGTRHVWSIGQVLTFDGIRATLAGTKLRSSAGRLEVAAKKQDAGFGTLIENKVTSLSTPRNAPVKSPKSRRQLVIPCICGIIMTAMLMGGQKTPRRLDREQKMDQCLAQIQSAIDATYPSAQLYHRLSALVDLINSAERVKKGSRVAIQLDAKLLTFCRSLAQTRDSQVTEQERRLAGCLADLLSRRTNGLSPQQLRSLEQCLTQIFDMLESHRREAALYSRMTSLADTICKCRSAESEKQAELTAERRDAIAFCRSLANAKGHQATDSERQLAKTLGSLLEQGV